MPRRLNLNRLLWLVAIASGGALAALDQFGVALPTYAIVAESLLVSFTAGHHAASASPPALPPSGVSPPPSG